MTPTEDKGDKAPDVDGFSPPCGRVAREHTRQLGLAIGEVRFASLEVNRVKRVCQRLARAKP